MLPNPRIEISQRTVVFTLAILAGLWVLVQIRDILFLLFIAFLLMTAIHPLVTFVERFRVPRVISIVIIYAVIFGFFGVSLFSAVPVLVSQSAKLIQELPSVASKVVPYWNIDFGTISQQIAPLSENLLKVTVGIFSNIVTTFTVLVFAFYFLLERRHADEILSSLLGETAGKNVSGLLRKIERRLGAWVRGELLLMTFVGVLSYIGLTVLHVEFALPLAILAGILEIVPMIGPTISAIPAVLVALAVSPLLALSVVALYFIVQQVENNLLVPVVMKRSVGFPPLVTILALLIGGRLAGVVGAILSVPVAVMVQVLFNTFVLKEADHTSTKVTKNP